MARLKMPSKMTLEYKMRLKRLSVIAQARGLADKLVTLAEKLERYPDALPCSLGELQSNGTTFDADCAALCALVDALGIVGGL